MSYADCDRQPPPRRRCPRLFVERAGATKDPWPSDETLRSSRGRGAGRAVRALVDFRPPYGVRDLAKRAGVPLGTLSRGPRPPRPRGARHARRRADAVTSIDWEGAIRRWAQDYDFARSNQIAMFLEPRGLDAVASKLADAQVDLCRHRRVRRAALRANRSCSPGGHLRRRHRPDRSSDSASARPTAAPTSSSPSRTTRSCSTAATDPRRAPGRCRHPARGRPPHRDRVASHRREMSCSTGWRKNEDEWRA